MIFKAIVSKEWIKLRLYFISIILFLIILLYHFWYSLNFSFETIEPETMMWYRYVFLDFKPYEYFKWILFCLSIIVAFAQFLPEWSKNRIKLTAHLPISIKTSLALHLGVGAIFVSSMSLLFIVFAWWILSLYYPRPITNTFLQDGILYYIGGLMSYISISSAILERNSIKAIIKFTTGLLCIWFFSFSSFGYEMLGWLVVLIWLVFVCFDSLLSIKEQTLAPKILIPSSFLVGIMLLYIAQSVFFDKFYHKVTDYYIFYSPIKKEFVYQRNFGEHRFEYGSKKGEKFTRKEYESYLPFVYWADLYIQKKLPIKIDGKSFDKQTIKKSRLSLSFSHKDLIQKYLPLYPLINSLQKLGIIPFPDNMVYL